MALVLLSIADGVARITLNRPDKLNSFTADLHVELRAALDQVEAAEGLACVVLTGAGRGFCAGQDLNERVRGPGEPPVDLGETLDRDMNPLIARLHALEPPLVAAVNGIAAGAGASLALACDIVVAAESAKFVFSFTRIGLALDGGASWALPRLVGQARAFGLAVTAEPVAAREAEHWGLIWRCVEDATFAGEVEALVERLRVAPRDALVATKALLRESPRNGLQEQLGLERQVQRERGFSADYAEGVAAFLERRPPRYTQG